MSIPRISSVCAQFPRPGEKDNLARAAEAMAKAPDEAKAQLGHLLRHIENVEVYGGLKDPGGSARQLHEFVHSEGGSPPSPGCFGLQLQNVGQLTAEVRRELGATYTACGTDPRATSKVIALQETLRLAVLWTRFPKAGTE